MSNKILKTTGLAIFLTGFLVFVLSLTMSKYTLTEETVRQQGDDERIAALIDAVKPMLGVTYTSNIYFVRDIKKAIDEANRTIIAKYTLDGQLAAKIARKAGEDGKYVFHSTLIDDILPATDEVTKYQNQAFKDYAGWLDGKTFDSGEALESQLRSIIQSINNSLSYKKAFDSYSAKNLLFWLTKNSSFGMLKEHLRLWIFLSFGLIILGALLYFYSAYYRGTTAGIKNNGIFMSPATGRGWIGIALGVFMISFYIILYFYPEYLTNWVVLVDPLSYRLNGGPASHWFLYGTLYTMAVGVMGVRMLLKYRHSTYQILRTLSVIFFQTAFAFIIPEILASLHKPAVDLKNIWPLDYDFFYSYNLDELMSSGALGWFMLFWGIALIIIAVPVFTYFFGKRWYCSWVCGCGGLAETLGDPFRQLSDKSIKAWKIERFLIYSVLVFAFVNTAGVLYTYFTGSYSVLGISTESIKSAYGFLISSIFAGVVGTGFYPLMGNRVWCRFGCPLAAYLGIVQKFKSRFRITTNGGQCISCGNCSTYCEMGIDVRWYAQRGQNIIRASCVGCGICAAVCPRGVLRLENNDPSDRFNIPRLTGNESFRKPANTTLVD